MVFFVFEYRFVLFFLWFVVVVVLLKLVNFLGIIVVVSFWGDFEFLGKVIIFLSVNWLFFFFLGKKFVNGWGNYVF